ncbi:MAG: SDR family oxidoreductase [Pseudomonadota bacterium]
MTNRLDDRTYIVTGGAGAIGNAIGQTIVDEGGKVLLVDLDGSQALENAKLIDPSGDRCAGIRADVTKQRDAEEAVRITKDVYGSVEGLVNNAGLIRMSSAWDATYEDWQKHFEVNTTGAFIMSQAIGLHLQETGGSIVNIASNCGKVGYKNMAAYNASKAAMISLTRSLSMEWAEHNINVNAICPGGVDTQMLHGVAEWLAPKLNEDARSLLDSMGAEQLGRKISPLEVARVVTFLLSDDAIIIRGQAISVDGGETPY